MTLNESYKRPTRSVRMLRALTTSFRKLQKKSDPQRWEGNKELPDWWDDRTVAIAQMISPGKTVLEFGAGRRVLEKNLKDCPQYTPSDIVDRGKGTLICDLNAINLPSFDAHDIVVFSGVLEYVHDVSRLIHHLSRNMPTIIASYAVHKDEPVMKRRGRGWVNDFQEQELINIFEENNYQVLKERAWGSQKIFIFKHEQL